MHDCVSLQSLVTITLICAALGLRSTEASITARVP